jgi:TFIIF-interacting CTD phosphatase-like protein
MFQKHLVLDLDNTLIYSSFEMDKIQKLQLDLEENRILRQRIRLVRIVDILDEDLKGTGIVSEFAIILRPHLTEFINFCLQYFSEISIWSAGQDRYVRAIEAIIFPNKYRHKKLSNVYTYSDCEILENNTTYKHLSKKQFDLNKTFVIDDRTDTFSKNKEKTSRNRIDYSWLGIK